LNQTKKILAVDDEPSMRRLLEISLRQAGYQPVLAANGREALDILRVNGADLVVSDLHMPGMGGIQLLEAMRGENIETPVIIVTAQGEISSAVAAMKLGAVDYILRPFDLETLELAISRALSITRLKLENTFLREQKTDETLVGDSEIMQKLKATLTQVAPEKATVLITGETGTGKEVVAQAIHKQSPRKNALFVAVNCAAIPAEMLESELFGHERGAFTGAVKERVGKFELADGGTLFLDEVTEMPIALQAKLLRAIQESQIERLGGNRTISVDIRLIAATNRDPQQAIKDGKLREDLYYRLNVFRLDLPPLRERKQDIANLAAYFLRHGQKKLSTSALTALMQYDWPGNVRELENVIERASIVCRENEILLNHLSLDVSPKPAQDSANFNAALPVSMSIPQAVATLEKELILNALNQTNGNKSKAAKLLEISERSLWYKLEQYELK
jgi:two-component system response regulator AtoC